MLVQALISEATVKRLDIRILVGLARLNQKELYLAYVGSSQHSPTTELFTVIGTNSFWQTSLCANAIEDTS